MSGYGGGGYGQGPYGGFGPVYQEPLAYYLGLIPSQYQTSPKFMAWLTALLTPMIDASNCVAFITSNFDLSTAVGVQLDILGQLVGVARTVGFQPSGGVSPVLTDSVYRLLIQARIAWNSWPGTIDSLYPIWNSLFPSGRLVIEDNQNMTATIIVAGTFTSIIVDLITNGYIIPRPEGVSYTYATSTLPIFGADENNSYVAGADLGHAA